jgi:MFS family permease
MLSRQRGLICAHGSSWIARCEVWPRRERRGDSLVCSGWDDGWLDRAGPPGGRRSRHAARSPDDAASARASLLRTGSWFISYGLLGLTQNGLVPVLMPLAAPHGGAAGLTYAAFSLLGVFAPFLGCWADRTGRHRDLLVWGSIFAGMLLLLFDVVPKPLRILLAAGAGLGAMATTTAGNVLAIEGQPEPLWDARVALLQRYISAGQVIGLCTAGLLARSHPSAGFIVAGLALLAAGTLAVASAPDCAPRSPGAKPGPRPMVGGDAGVSGPHHRGHHLSWLEFRTDLRVISWPLRHFLIVWLIAYPAMTASPRCFRSR